MNTTARKERPILFRPELVRKILDSTKTQTRRPLKPQPPLEDWERVEWTVEWYEPAIEDDDGMIDAGPAIFGAHYDDEWGIKCPFGAPGDVLWVRETWGPCEGGFCYLADEGPEVKPDGGRWKPSIHMPREACRLLLENQEVRVERVRDITPADVVAEGYPFHSDRDAFGAAWNQTYPGSWERNEFCWVISFRRTDA